MFVKSIGALVVLAVIAGLGYLAMNQGSSDEGIQNSSPPSGLAMETKTFITPAQLSEMEGAIIIDARSAEAYAGGHIPSAISMPGKLWRTGKAKPGQGDSQYLFRTDNDEVDVARYEAFLGSHGLTRDDTLIVYGNHAGKTDGSIPAMVLDVLGHEDVYFLDGIGVDQWVAAGNELEAEPTVLEQAQYQAKNVQQQVIWNLDDVLAHLDDENVVFLDTRSLSEYEGTETRRPNARKGHIPGAIRIDYFDMLHHAEGETADKTSLDPAKASEMLLQAGVTPDKTVVLYCQTSTRVSLPYFLLKDLGYEQVVVYDASWHEYGNRSDTPIVSLDGLNEGPATP